PHTRPTASRPSSQTGPFTRQVPWTRACGETRCSSAATRRATTNATPRAAWRCPSDTVANVASGDGPCQPRRASALFGLSSSDGCSRVAAIHRPSVEGRLPMAPIRVCDRGLIALFSLLSVLGMSAPVAAASRPNIVFILADDQRWDTIDKTHSVDGTTPVMQNVTTLLVRKGVLFQNHFVTTALCAPSRSSILAGKYAHTTGVHSNGGTDGGVQAFDDSSTVAVWLKAAGYHTGLFGKYLNGYNTVAPYQPPGWDEWHAFKAPGYFGYHLIENGVDVPYG